LLALSVQIYLVNISVSATHKSIGANDVDSSDENSTKVNGSHVLHGLSIPDFYLAIFAT
jgi:hypothetical protein